MLTIDTSFPTSDQMRLAKLDGFVNGGNSPYKSKILTTCYLQGAREAILCG